MPPKSEISGVFEARLRGTYGPEYTFRTKLFKISTDNTVKQKAFTKIGGNGYQDLGMCLLSSTGPWHLHCEVEITKKSNNEKENISFDLQKSHAREKMRAYGTNSFGDETAWFGVFKPSKSKAKHN